MTAKVIQLRDFNEVVRICGRKIEAIETSTQKVRALRIEVGQLLIELRDRVEAGEIGELANWWDWFEDNKALFGSIERRTAERYMQVAGDPDPVAKQDELRKKNTEQRRDQGKKDDKSNIEQFPSDRRKKGDENQGETKPKYDLDPKPEPDPEPEPAPVRRVSAAPTYPSSPEDDGLIEQFTDLFRRMSWDGRVRAMKAVGALFDKWRVGEDA
jgi:hypothetical protein